MRLCVRGVTRDLYKDRRVIAGHGAERVRTCAKTRKREGGVCGEENAKCRGRHAKTRETWGRNAKTQEMQTQYAGTQDARHGTQKELSAHGQLKL